jgi:hypothetical protein
LDQDPIFEMASSIITHEIKPSNGPKEDSVQTIMLRAGFLSLIFGLILDTYRVES